MRKGEVLVYGANGHTGRFIVAELLRQGLTPILAGRNAAALASLGKVNPELEVAVAAVDDARILDEAMSGVAVVINAAGPFLDTARPLAAAAVRGGAHYLDVSAEQQPVRCLYDVYGQGGEAAGTSVIPAMSFYGGLADLLVTSAADDWENVDEVEVGIGLNHWWPTAGTRVTGERNSATRLVVEDSDLVEIPLTPKKRTWSFSEPIGTQTVVEMPFSEMITMSKHLLADKMSNFLSEIALEDIRHSSTAAPQAVDHYGRSAQQFTVEAIVTKDGKRRRAEASGQDIYHVTAPLVVEAAQRLIDGRSFGSSALAPGEAFDARDLLTTLGRDWLRLDPTFTSLPCEPRSQ